MNVPCGGIHAGQRYTVQSSVITIVLDRSDSTFISFRHRVYILCIVRCKAMVSRNIAAALEQHHELLLVLRGISTNMNQITDRLEYNSNTVKTLQKTLSMLKISYLLSRTGLENIKDNTSPSDSSLNVMMTNMGNINYENTVIIKKLPDNKSDEFDTNALIGLGICEDVLTKRVARSDSHNNKPGVLKVEFYTLDDKMKIRKSKQRLRATNEYYDVYIKGY